MSRDLFNDMIMLQRQPWYNVQDVRNYEYVRVGLPLVPFVYAGLSLMYPDVSRAGPLWTPFLSYNNPPP